MNIIEILDKHSLWLKGDATGVQADLSGMDLSDMYLREVGLCGADLQKAKLVGTNLSHVRLWGADLQGADMSHAILIGTDLRYADLTDANLTGADLSYADLEGSTLSSGKRSVLLENGTVGTIIGTPKVGDFVKVELHDENGIKRSKTGIVAEIL